MGAGNPEEEYGVRDFKARFGGDLIEFGRFKKIFMPLLYSLGKTALKMLSFRKE
jgi:lipid II:glycine glycyltransferase (peptidoglycan interpeptide bridge formation enzyme)